MLDKVKKDRLIISIIAIASAVIAIASTAVVVLLILKMNYVPMWFVLAASAICYYLAVFTAFAAIDRSTAIRALTEIELLGSYDTEPLAQKLGWNTKATEKFVKKLLKWGYIS